MSLGEAGLCRDSVISHQLPTQPTTRGINASVLEGFQPAQHATSTTPTLPVTHFHVLSQNLTAVLQGMLSAPTLDLRKEEIHSLLLPLVSQADRSLSVRFQVINISSPN